MNRILRYGENIFYYDGGKWVPAIQDIEHSINDGKQYLTYIRVDGVRKEVSSGLVVRWQDLKEGDKVICPVDNNKISTFKKIGDSETYGMQLETDYYTYIEKGASAQRWDLGNLRPYDLSVSGYPKIASTEPVVDKGPWVPDAGDRVYHKLLKAYGRFVEVRNPTSWKILKETNHGSEETTWDPKYVIAENSVPAEKTEADPELMPGQRVYNTILQTYGYFEGLTENGNVRIMYEGGNGFPKGSIGTWSRQCTVPADKMSSEKYEPKVGDHVHRYLEDVTSPHYGIVKSISLTGVCTVVDTKGQERKWDKVYLKLISRADQEQPQDAEPALPTPKPSDIRIGDWVRLRGSDTKGRVEHIHGSGTRMLLKLLSGRTLHWDLSDVVKIDHGAIEIHTTPIGPDNASFDVYDIVRKIHTTDFYVVTHREMVRGRWIYTCVNETGIKRELAASSLVSEEDSIPKPNRALVEYQMRLRVGAQSSYASIQSWAEQYAKAAETGMKVHAQMEKSLLTAQRYGSLPRYMQGVDPYDLDRRRAEYPLTEAQAFEKPTDEGVQLLKTPGVGKIITIEDDIALL